MRACCAWCAWFRVLNRPLLQIQPKCYRDNLFSVFLFLGSVELHLFGSLCDSLCSLGNPWGLAYRQVDKISSPTVLPEEVWSYDSFRRNAVCNRNNYGETPWHSSSILEALLLFLHRKFDFVV